MFGMLLSFWEGLVSGAMLVLGSVPSNLNRTGSKAVIHCTCILDCKRKVSSLEPAILADRRVIVLTDVGSISFSVSSLVCQCLFLFCFVSREKGLLMLPKKSHTAGAWLVFT